MSNYVRACFCIPSLTNPSNLYNLLLALAENNCTYNTWIRGSVQGYQTRSDRAIDIHEIEVDLTPSSAKMLRIAEWLAEPGYVTVKLGWKTDSNIYETEIIQIWREESVGRSIRLCIEEDAFLPNNLTEFTNLDSNLFRDYKKLVGDFIKHTSPTLGMIDYEADLLCEPINPMASLVSWGNFYSNEYLAQWTSNNINKIVQIVDESQTINNIGLLTFIHPLQANQAWTTRHEQVYKILQNH